MISEHLSLHELLQKGQDALKAALPSNYWVVAEIASMSGSRHVYFELIEKQGERILAKCRANLWSYNSTRVITHFQMITREQLKPGMKLLLNVSVDFHVQYGFSLTIQDIDPSYSLGEFERIKLETIEKLREDGLLDMNKNVELPKVLKNLAVVSSETAAGYQDFLEQLSQNEYNLAFKTTLFPALVQGENAPQSLLKAINAVERSTERFDALVLIRGGGSVIDLSCFDDFEFNFNLAQSTLPIITGIGHERDQSVSDLVAHTTLKTPTAVAQFIIENNLQFLAEIEEIELAILNITQRCLMAENRQLDSTWSSLNLIAKSQPANAKWQLEKNWQQVITKANRILQIETQHLSEKKFRLKANTLSLIHNELNELKIANNQLESWLPENVLKRGYAFINELEIKEGQEITIQTLTKTIKAKTIKILPHE
ncbi:MAG: exodeoxyribonuclease VII large subunit [Bacteroidetes bacterium]|nr:exodeoxyribonuclease VII large subunit [Bacteroidota bacterium]